MPDQTDEKVLAERSTKETEALPVPISREATFARMAADSVLVIDRGPDVELSLLIHERSPTEMLPEPDSAFVNLDGEFTMKLNLVEIGKVRISAATSINLAMNILHSNIQAERLNIDGFKKSIDDMIENASGAGKATAE
ncbi:hypothetical protein FGU71_10840 [Erythrobacter insulae]|uniref:Uncharacterized protein n=1 Tax=Erythrobacter insulae TaxID=2584124 RepID=A0A547PDU9_9SPHN|nr:hypothetical protein [Erythrobacter insulae]TRD12310.1 hypothetical protein FGU71_10840 [Erythrobacter insulae]